MSGAALAAAIFAVIEGETAGYAAWWIIGLFVFSAVAAVAFVGNELAVENPLLELRYLRILRFLAANVVAFTTEFGVFSIFFFVALYLQLLAN